MDRAAESGGTPAHFLVTGATGFIGSHLVPALVRAHGGTCLTALVPARRDVREQQRLDGWTGLGIHVLECDLLSLDRQRPPVPPYDVVYHLAGYAVTENPAGPFEVNSRGTRLLLDWLGSSLRGKRVIYAGTLASIDCRARLGAADETTPCAPVTVYGRTKLEGEQWIRTQAPELGFRYSILRLCTIVGPGYRPGGMFGVFPAMLRRGAVATRLNWPGRASFLAVRDLVRILLALPECDADTNTLYVTGNGEAPSFDQLLDLLARALRIRRRRLVLPGWWWGCARRLAWLGARSPLSGAKARIFCWRVYHLCGDGLLADASRLNQRLRLRCQSLEQTLHEVYAQTDPDASHGTGSSG